MAPPISPPATFHGTCIAIGAQGIMLVGASGAGKSDLALRLIDRGAKLVADDRCELVMQGGQLLCRPPAILAGKIEVRGLGIFDLPWIAPIPIIMAVRLADRYERMPDCGVAEILAGHPVDAVKLAPFEASAALKVEMALERRNEKG